jgi:molybdate transport system substrate-binding protein
VLLVAVASNAEPVVQAIAHEYARIAGIDSGEIALTSGASGALCAQAENGAPFDIFISADTVYPRRLAASLAGASSNGVSEGGGGADGRGDVRIYAWGRIALWISPRLGTPLGGNGTDGEGEVIALLRSDKIKTIAIANPELAPYGAAAVSWLNREGIDPGERLITAESVGQLSHFIAADAADAAITAWSTLHPGLQGRMIRLEAERIPQGALILPHGREKSDAAGFMEFLLSEQGAGILRSFGYETE